MPHKEAEIKKKKGEKPRRGKQKNKGEVVLNFICVVALWLNVL